MPVSNDLTPEEEAEFVQRGLAPAGQGKEPLDEANAAGQGEGGEQQGQQGAEGGEQGQQQGQHGDRRPNGQFKSREELEAERLLAEQGQQGGEQGQQGEPKMVPHEALHEARQRAAAAIRQAATLTTRMNAILNARRGQEGQRQEQLPDLAEDPVGYITGLERRLAAFENERVQETEFRQIDSSLEQDEAMFAIQVPDYSQASDHYVQSRARELLAFYPPEEAKQIMTQEARQIAQEAWKRGQSPAAMIYSLAQARGYVPRQGGQGGQGGQGEGGQRGASAMERVAAAGRAQEQSRSLSGGGGSGGAAALNAEAVLAMSDDEFEEYLGLGKKGADARFAAIG